MKTVTMRVDDSTYHVIKMAAKGQKRNISNFLEYATLQYLSSTQYVDHEEMNEILEDEELVQNLKSGLVDLENGKFKLV